MTPNQTGLVPHCQRAVVVVAAAVPPVSLVRCAAPPPAGHSSAIASKAGGKSSSLSATPPRHPSCSVRVRASRRTSPMPDLREHALAFGVQTLADVDLLALLLGTGSAGESVALSAAALLEGSGGLEGIARLGPHALARRGIGPAKATRIAAAVERGRRALLQVLAAERVLFDCFEQVARWARPRLGAL